MTAATISNWSFKFNDQTASPTSALVAIEEVYSVSNVGKTNQLVEVTNFDSAVGTKEYIAGLAEGDEITVEANYIPGATNQPKAMTLVDNGSSRTCVLTYTGSSPQKKFTFTGVFIGYSVAPSPTERNSIRYTIKISGAVTRT